ncbi:MAG TPA: ATPase domain-containing protein, partial [Spirochaetales bacterium]|nr:ATPase domain-containing protein [Spirochaetales bacterium]
MAKQDRTTYICSSCHHEEPKWLGRCPACGAWNTFQEASASRLPSAQHIKQISSIPLTGITTVDKPRFSSGIEEVDRVLGGGIVPGMSVLIGGEPGIGKSTLLMSVASKSETKGTVLYVSGEESPQQIKMRADRLGVHRDKIELLCTNDLTHVLTALEKLHPVILIVDSIQTLIAPEAGTIPGTANQIKYCALELAEWGRNHDTASFLVAHVTKDGMIAGPKAAEHIVDVVLMFEQNDTDARFLRSSKNRFGSVDEVGLFLMGETGLEEISDSSGFFLGGKRDKNPIGVAVAATWEG